MTATDDLIERILRDYDTITVVGASVDPAKAAHDVPAYMQHRGWRIIPVNPHADEIMGDPDTLDICYRHSFPTSRVVACWQLKRAQG